jgi:hypothetical protein
MDKVKSRVLSTPQSHGGRRPRTQNILLLFVSLQAGANAAPGPVLHPPSCPCTWMRKRGSADRRFRGPRLFPKARKQCWAGDPRTGEHIRPAPNSKLAEPRRPPAGRGAERKDGGPRCRLTGCGLGAWVVRRTERSAPPRRSERHPSSSEEGSSRRRRAGCGLGEWLGCVTNRSAPPGAAPPRRSERHPSSSEEGSSVIGD